MKIKIMYRDFFVIEMKLKFLMKWVLYFNCVYYLFINFLKLFFILYYYFVLKFYYCLYIVFIGIFKILYGNKFKKCKIRVFKELIVEKVGFFCRYFFSGLS